MNFVFLAHLIVVPISFVIHQQHSINSIEYDKIKRISATETTRTNSYVQRLIDCQYNVGGPPGSIMMMTRGYNSNQNSTNKNNNNEEISSRRYNKIYFSSELLFVCRSVRYWVMKIGRKRDGPRYIKVEENNGSLTKEKDSNALKIGE